MIAGVDVSLDRTRALSRLGAIFEAPAFYDYLSGWKNLQIFTAYSHPVAEAEMREAVALVRLTGQIDDCVRTYSHGMRQRLALAQALLPRPEVLILDEPTEGLDPEGIHEMRKLILELNRQHGITIILCSHLLTEVEQLCPRVAILQQGELVFCGPWRDAGSSAFLDGDGSYLGVVCPPGAAWAGQGDRVPARRRFWTELACPRSRRAWSAMDIASNYWLRSSSDWRPSTFRLLHRKIEKS